MLCVTSSGMIGVEIVVTFVLISPLDCRQTLRQAQLLLILLRPALRIPPRPASPLLQRPLSRLQQRPLRRPRPGVLLPSPSRPQLQSSRVRRHQYLPAGRYV